MYPARPDGLPSQNLAHATHPQFMGASPLEGPQPSDALDLASILRVIRERYKIIAAATAVGLVLAVIFTILTTPLYRAFVTLEVNPPKVEVIEGGDRMSGSEAPAWDTLLTQIGLLKSRSLAERVVQDLNLVADPRFAPADGKIEDRIQIATNRVSSGIDVSPPKEGQLIRFSYTSEDPALAAKIANGLADGFIDSSLQRRFEASNHARSFLQKQINSTRGALEASEKALVAYAQKEGIINTGSGEAGSTTTDASSLQGSSLVALNSALAEATAKRIEAEGAYRQARLAGASSDVQASTSALRGNKAALEAEYQEKRALLKPEHPDMIALKSRIDELSRQINAEQSRLAGGKATSLLADYRAALAAESALKQRVAALRGSVLDLRGRSIQYNILQRDVDTNRSLYDALLARYKEVGVAGGVGNSPVSIVDRANTPGAPFKPNVLLNLIAGLGAGFIAGLLFAIVSEILNDVIKTREDVRTKLRQACLGVIPRRDAKSNIIENLDDAHSGVSEAYNAVLSTLRFSTETGAPHSLLVTSSAPSEGKSSSAFALARGYARRGEKVLLIDSDLRRPVFKARGNPVGLSQLLTRDLSLESQVLTTQFEDLWLLPCGPTPPNPADLLATSRLATILERAKHQFDRVIIDGPPLIGLADATLLATAAHNVVMVVESGRTRTKAALHSLDQMRNAGAHILGVVLTKSAEEASSYGYGYYDYSSVEGQSEKLILITGNTER